VIRIVVVNGPSMAPALRDGDRVLVRRTRAVRWGDIVLVAMPTGWILKRVAATACDAGLLYLLGDNAAESIDSRDFGCVPAERVYGVVVRKLRRMDSSS
jgi:signal peptidase I